MNGNVPIGGFALLLTCDRTAILRLEMAVNVVLLIPKSIHRDPMAKRLHLFPYLWVSLLDPSLDLSLLLNVGSGIIPVAETISRQHNSRLEVLLTDFLHVKVGLVSILLLNSLNKRKRLVVEEVTRNS